MAYKSKLWQISELPLWQITAPHFVAGFSSNGRAREDHQVVHAADIIKYMECWSLLKVRNYCEQKGWKLVKIKD